MRFLSVLPVFLLSISCAGSLWGHARGESYLALELKGKKIEGNVEIHLSDLREWFTLGTDFMDDPWQKIEDTSPPVKAYIREHISIAAHGREYPLQFTTTSMIGGRVNGWALYHFEIEFEDVPPALDLRVDMFYEFDRLHRNLLLWIEPMTAQEDFDGTYLEGQVAMVFGPSTAEQQLNLSDIPSIRQPKDMIEEGVWHIWIGYDHVLFILALLLPTVMVWQKDKREWRPVEGFGKAFFKILKIVTVFTVAHSITLALAAFEYVSISSRLVESVIALSIILVAVGNIIGGNFKSSIVIIFALGLFHGLGFASVMGELPFRVVHNLALKSVLFFNVGVEIGQLAIVMALFPLLFLFRKHAAYPLVVLRGASALLALIAGFWFIQRAFALT